MSFQDVAKSVRAVADARGLHATMSRLNDAIALACYGKKYAAVIAAEKAGKLPPMLSPSPHIATAARRYQMDEYAFGLALHSGIEGPQRAGNEGAVDMAMGWLLAKHKPELLQLEERELTTVANPVLVEQVLARPEFASMAVYGFAEWVIAEGEMRAEGCMQKVSKLLLHGKSRPAWNARERAYLSALASAPLCLYLVEAVVSGYRLTLRPLDVKAGHLVQVSERSGSRPDLVGSVIAARVIAHNDRLELAGGLFTFTTPAGHQLAKTLRRTEGAASVSRAIRSAWFEQFDQPHPQIVLAGSGEPLRLITDTYRCPSLSTLGERLAEDSRVEGSQDLGWCLVVREEDGRERQMCAINLSEDATEFITVFYESEHRARIYRPWFEAKVGDAATFVGRESRDPLEAAMDPSLAKVTRKEPRFSADDMSALMAGAYTQLYADFADTPLPMLDGSTPRQMLRQPGGEARVRDVLAMYESNERRAAHHDRREPVGFDFLYVKLGLAQIQPTVVTRPMGLFPDQFAVNEAWVVFRMLGDPMTVMDAGEVDIIGLMDAGSTCILNFAMHRTNTDLTEIEARSFFQKLKVPVPSHTPRRVYVASDVVSASLRTEASRRGFTVETVDARDLDGIVGEAKEAIEDGFGTFLDNLE